MKACRKHEPVSARWARFFASEGTTLVLNVNVIVVAPVVGTDKLAAWGKENPEMYEENIEAAPLGRYGEAEKDIGQVWVFLGSDDAKCVMGDTVMIQGGLGMGPGPVAR